MSKQDGTNRTYHWWFILYPESAPADWLEQLEMTMVKIAISPLHEHDLDADGNTKKPHYHVILSYDSLKSYNQVVKITESLNQPIPIPIQSLAGAHEYLTHANNPDKYQYSKDDIKYMNGFKIDAVEGDEKMAVVKELCSIIMVNGMTEFSQLVQFVSEFDQSDKYFKALVRNPYFYGQLIQSLYHQSLRKR